MKFFTKAAGLLAGAVAVALAAAPAHPPVAPIADGWQNLFDGKTLTGWKRLAGTADYRVENGAIVGTAVLGSGNTFLVTER